MTDTHHKLDGGPLSLEEAKRTVEVVNTYATMKEAAAFLGISERGLSKRLQNARLRHGLGIAKRKTGPTPITLPTFPPADVPFAERRELQGRSFEMRRASYNAHTWFEVKHHDLLPIGYAFVGDPHGDDDGHNVKQYDNDIALLAGAEGVYPVNMGDITNNWPPGGRLADKWKDQSFSRHDAIQFTKYSLNQLDWFLVLLGNHDDFSRDTEDLIREIMRDTPTIIHKWDARFVLNFPNGRRCYVRAAHDYKGKSWFHELHGNIRAFMDCPAHIVVAAHHHDAAYYKHEVPAIAHLMNPGLPFLAHLLRVRGYKHMDTYALVKGYDEYQEGASALAIIDPQAERGGTFVEVDTDLERGLERLAEMRRKRA
jgi:hypothetical protein